MIKMMIIKRWWRWMNEVVDSDGDDAYDDGYDNDYKKRLW